MKKDSKQQLLENFKRVDPSFTGNKLNENIFNTPQMGGVLNSKGTAGYIPNTKKQDDEYAKSVDNNIPENYKNEYQELINQFGDRRVNSLFPSGLKGFFDSRTRGNYSMDAIKQNLK